MPTAGFGVFLEATFRVLKGNYSKSNADIASSTSADTFGSWVQMIGDVGDRDILLFGLAVKADDDLDATDDIAVELGIGAAASEVAILSVSRAGDSTGTGEAAQMPLSIRIPASSRIAARTKDSNASAENQLVQLYYKIL